MTNEEVTKNEVVIKRLEEKHSLQRSSLYEFLLFYRKEEKKIELDRNRHIEEICRLLQDVYYGKITRLQINIPPRALKTEILRVFAARCLGKKNDLKFMGISYSSDLALESSTECRAIYSSQTFLSVFPRAVWMRDDKSTKQHRQNTAGGQYYAAGSTGSITGFGCDIMMIDDPLKPSEADSDTVRTGVNNNYHNTLYSRLNDKTKGAIIIIMQRLHDDDLCGYLEQKEKEGGDKWVRFIVKGIAEEDDQWRKKGESFFEKRFPLTFLQMFKIDKPQTFSSQFQQEPTNKETQEFHEEWFKYYWPDTANPQPPFLRIFTAVDPAFTENKESDETSVITVWFVDARCYILEITAGKFAADVMQEKILYHLRKWKPEKIGIEAYQAQRMIGTFLRLKMQEERIYTQIEEIKQIGDKNSKLRRLIPLYKNGFIFHKREESEQLEYQLKKFPRGKHDDIPDSLQMVYEMYTLVPNNAAHMDAEMGMSWDANGQPRYNNKGMEEYGTLFNN